jgi:hypothetical protein
MRRLFLTAGTILFAVGMAGLLIGFERLRSRSESRAKPERCFRIRRTKLDADYVYWVVEGLGRHKCFVLCDTWQDAIDEANRRLRVTQPKPEIEKFLVTSATGVKA